MVFTARTDSAGRILSGNCDYVIVGQTPTAELWTLTAYDGDSELISNPASRTGFHSREILRHPDGSFSIIVSGLVQPGNWLPIGTATNLILVLRLYDTPLTTGLIVVEQTMPTIVAGACR